MKVLYFAWMRERTGLSEEIVETAAATPRDLLEELRARSDGHALAFNDVTAVRVAIDQALVEWDAPLAGASEVAFFPPMTGG